MTATPAAKPAAAKKAAPPPPAPAPTRGPMTGAANPARSRGGSRSNGAAPAGVGAYSVGGAGRTDKRGHPALRFTGIGDPSAYRAWAAGITRHEMAGAAGVREADGHFARSVRDNKQLTRAQRGRIRWKMRRAHRKLAGALEAAAKAAAAAAKTRQEVDNEVLASGPRRPAAHAYKARS